MNTKTIILSLILCTLSVQASVRETEINGAYRHQVRENGFVTLDHKETLKEGVLTGEHWARSLWETPTQRVTTFKALRDGGGWLDIENQFVEWINDVPQTNAGQLQARGFLGGRSSGSCVWEYNGTRTLMVATVEFDVKWDQRTGLCITNDSDGNPVDRMCFNVSTFRYQKFPVVTVDLTNLAAVTLTQYQPGHADNSQRRVRIPVPMGSMWNWRGRDECYYCEGSPACWHPHWGQIWQPPSGTVAAFGKTVTVTMPAPTGAMATVFRSENLETWEPIGTAASYDGEIIFTDTNAPTQRAFYRWEGM